MPNSSLIIIYKKKATSEHTIITFGRSEDLRAKFVADISIFDPHMFLSVDESGFRQKLWIALTMRGMWIEDRQLKLGRASVNAIAVMSHEGVMTSTSPKKISRVKFLKPL